MMMTDLIKYVVIARSSPLEIVATIKLLIILANNNYALIQTPSTDEATIMTLV
jgi:hypothetical protein